MPIREVSSLTNPLAEALTKKKLNLWQKKKADLAGDRRRGRS